ncbi:MAG: DUF3429 domain-containing protein [Pseudomonadota bacterium]
MMINRDNTAAPGSSNRAHAVIPLLGYAGLLPFLIALIARGRDVTLMGHAPESLFASYSAVILAFLAGSLWGRAQYQPHDQLVWRLLLLSNAVAVLVWITIFAVDPAASLPMLAAGFVILWWFESRWDREMTPSYQRLRNRLTALVVLSHGLMIWV